MRTQPSYPLLSFLQSARLPFGRWSVPLLLFAMCLPLANSGCYPVEISEVELPFTATLTVDISDPNVLHDGTGGYTYEYEGQIYPATHKAWLSYECPESPQFFAAYNDVNQTVWLAHCVEGIFLNTVHITTNGENANPTPFLTEITGGHEETIELQIPTSNLEDISNGASQLVVTFNYQND